jgi:hypothetical protein
VRHEAIPASVAGFMYVEKRHHVTFANRMGLHVHDVAPNRTHYPDGNMSGNDGVRNLRESSILQVHVCSADFGKERFQDNCSGFEHRHGEFPNLDRLTGAGHHGG